MKHFHKTIGQSLVTVLMTSTVLEVYMLPIFGASNPTNSSGGDIQSPGMSTSPSAQAAIEVATPETIASPRPADASAVNSPDAIPEAATPEATPEAVTSKTALPEPVADTETQPIPIETTAQTANTARQNLEGVEPDRLAASKQTVSERLAALVNRDRLSKEAQLQQNLVALALYYAQLGEFADARQVAQHPALSLEMQVATLAEIEKLASPGQPISGVIRIPGQLPGQSAGQPGQPATSQLATSQLATSQLATSQLATALLTTAETGVKVTSLVNLPDTGTVVPATPPVTPSATPIDTSIASSFPEGGYMTVPSTPELLQPYLSDRCLNSSSAVTNLPASEKTAGVLGTTLPKRSSPFLPIGQKVAARLSADRVAQVVKPTAKQTQPILVTQTVRVSRVAPIAPSPQPKPSLRQASLPNVPASNATATPSLTVSANKGDRLADTAEGTKVTQETVKDLEMAVPSVIPHDTPILNTLQSILESWMYRASPGTGSSGSVRLSSKADGQGARYKLSPSPQLIRLSREASKISASPEVHKSVAVGQTVSLASNSTSGYWRTIAANCGGLQSDSTVSSPGNRLASDMIFPLPIPVPLTSGFGWRTHPIGGDRRFHSGIDLGAPFGTPVLSALAGRVVLAEAMGGYGLVVVVEANSVQQQNLYAHLSAIAVKPGDRVEQGSVLGLVGSTGSSTGPHLHFETLLPSAQGWTAVDPLGAAVAAVSSTQVSQK